MRAIGRFFMWLLAGIGFLTMASVIAGVVFLVTQSPQQPTVPERSVLWLDLNQPVVEKPVQTLFGKTVGLTMIDMVAALDRARTDDRIKGVVAVIGGADPASIGVHKGCGFAMIGRMPGTGFKFGRWLDTVIMQKALGGGAEAPADATLYPGPIRPAG